MTYKMIAQIARCSSGAVGAEMRAWRAEKVLQEKLEKETIEALPKLDLDHVFSTEKCPQDEFKNLSFDLSGNFPDLEIELER